MRATATLAAAVMLAGAAAGTVAGGARTLPSFTPCPPVKPSVRPTTVVVACGDGNFFLGGLRWSRWTGRSAFATGTAHANDCNPYCAAGRFHTYPASLQLTRPRTCAHGRREFTRFTYRFLAAKPAAVPRAATSPSGGTGCP
ncbi:MAG TPA: hypothetical protein VFA82_08430 [Gaiellaceae bacterium]|nr:hypothetical protein [Gaiellaceae bacterium]